VRYIKKILRRFGTDIGGYVCLLLVIPVGSLPGPGGIPLLVAGLSLLSVHNPWARKLLEYVKIHSESLRSIFFPKNKRIELAWDFTAAALFVGSFVVLTTTDTRIISLLSTSTGAGATTIFMMNRGRLNRIMQYRKKL
jgi:hypothetical protein